MNTATGSTAIVAETVSIGPGELLAGLLILLLGLVLLAGVIGSGFLFAIRAGRGSRGAFVGWMVVLVLEGLLLAFDVGASISARSVDPFALVFAVPIVLQVLSYRRHQKPPPPPGPNWPPPPTSRPSGPSWG